jgi:hypothetical protein
VVGRLVLIRFGVGEEVTVTAVTHCFVDLDEGVPMPSGWSPYPSLQEIAEHDARMASLGSVERDELPHSDDLLDRPDLSGDPAAPLSLLAGEGSGATSFDLGVLEAVDPAALSEPMDKLAVLKGLDKVEGLVGALRIRALTALGGTAPSGSLVDQMHLEHEIAVARRTSDYSAGRALDLARTITATFPEFLAALGAGRVSWSHLAVLVERTRFVQDPTALAEIGTRALVRALTRTPGQFATEVEKLVARFDPDAAERHRRAKKKDRKVWVKQLADGMGMLGYIDEWAVVNAVFETINADGKAMKKARRAKKSGSTSGEAAGTKDGGEVEGSGNETPGTNLVPVSDRDLDHVGDDLSSYGAACATDTGAGEGDADADADADAGGDVEADAHHVTHSGAEQEQSADSDRADALAARVLGVVSEDGSVTWERSASTQVQTSLVADLLTLRGLQDGIGLLDGQPIPAEIVREIAVRTHSWRRFVTDPVDGHLIDRGTDVYVDPHLRSLILARDICRNPVHRHALTSTRLEMDHAEEFPHGATSAANCGALCIPSHQLKTARRVDITGSDADGSCTWTTDWGQVVHIAPRPFLDHPDPPATEQPEPAPPDDSGPTQHAPPPDDDPPPF